MRYVILVVYVVSIALTATSVSGQKPTLVFTLKHDDVVRSARFSQDGRLVITTSDDETAKLWDATTGAKIAVLKGHTGIVISSAFSPDTKYVVTTSTDKTAKLWDVATGKLRSTTKGNKDITWRAAFSPDGRYFAFTTNNEAKIIETATGKLLWELQGHSGILSTITFNGTSTYAVTGSEDKTAKVWDIATGKLVVTLAGSLYGIDAAGFTPDGSQIVTTSFNRTSLVWDVATGKMVRGANGPEVIYAIPYQFSPGGEYLATSGTDNFAKIWEPSSMKMLYTLNHSSPVQKVEFSPAGSYAVTCSDDKTAKIWKMPGLASIPAAAAFRPTAPARLEISSIAFSDQKGNNNNILDANEQAEIIVNLSNTGKGEAYSLVVDTKLVNKLKGIDFTASKKVGTLQAGGVTVVNIPISATLDVVAGTAELEINVKEANGFDADPIRISFSTQKFKNPQLSIVDYKFATENGGKIKLGQSVSLQVVVQNRGQGVASNVHVVFNNPPNVFPGSDGRMTIDELEPNKTQVLSYEFFANKMYSGNSIPIDVVISEHYNKFGEARRLNVSLEQNLSKTQIVSVVGLEDKPIRIEEVSLSAPNHNTAPASTSELSPDANGKPLFYSLFIGIEKYQFASASLVNLSKPVMDAASLKSILLKDYSFTEQNSFFLNNATRQKFSMRLKILPRESHQRTIS